jgi:GNAT superfamily N-acetyltransferase
VNLTVRRATPDELDIVSAIFAEATAWLAAQGSDQWQYPPNMEKITGSVEAGTCYLAFLDGEPVATITIDDIADPEFWTPDDAPEAALYVHRLAILRKAAGQEMGATLLDFAARLADEAGKPLLRLDAWKSNTGLHQYYRDRGWRYVRTVDLPHRKSGVLFERPVSDVRNEDSRSVVS